MHAAKVDETAKKTKMLITDDSSKGVGGAGEGREVGRLAWWKLVLPSDIARSL